jgi:signal transduction histidine kinase
MRVITILLVATMMSCASAREKNLKRFKEITKDVCIENPNEAKLAQILYNEIVNGG